MSNGEPTQPVGLFASLDHYWFGRGSATTLGVYRIVVGFLALVNFLMLAVDWETWFSERGYTPSYVGYLWMGDRTPLGLGTNITIPRLNVLNGIVDPRLAIAIYAITTLAALFTMLGLGTRVSAFLLAVGTISLHHRNPEILHGGDTVLRLSTIYLAVSPCGRACSLDRLLGLYRGTDPAAPVPISVWPMRLVTFNVALLYLTAVWIKRFGDKWMNGTATWYPARLAEFYRFPVPAFFNQLPMVRVTTYGTLLVEFAMATIVFFRPLRNYVLVGGILMHGYIEYSMNIPLFSYLMMANYICFFEGEEIAEWVQRVGLRFRRFHVTVSLPEGTRLKPVFANLLSAVDPLNAVAYLPGESNDWSASRYDGSKIDPFRAIITRSPGLWALFWFPGLRHRILADSIEAAQVAPKSPSPRRPKSVKSH